MSRASIELNWLSRRDKQIPLPALVFGSLNGPQGVCYAPWWGEVEVDGVLHGTDKGLIVIDPDEATSVAATLAHEWRHHWQTMNGWKIAGSNHDFSDPDTYWGNIRDFFRSQPWEMDALRFELAMAPCEMAKQFMDAAQ
jgi:hypothetical protein